jgi:hypothetical protein
LVSFEFPISLSASFCFVLKSEFFIIALYYETSMNMHELSPTFACLLSLPLWALSYCAGSIMYVSYEENFLLRTLETVLYLAVKFHLVYVVWAGGSVVVKAPYYKPEGRGFDTR